MCPRTSWAILAVFFMFPAAFAHGDEEQPSAPDTYGLALIRRVLAEDEVLQLARDVRDTTGEQELAARREILGSDETLELLTWLGAYAKARVDGHPDDLRKFRERLEVMSSTEVKLVLLRLRMQRDHMRDMSAASLRRREQALTVGSRGVAGGTTRSTSPTAGHQGESLANYFENNPYQTSRQAVPRRQYYRLPPPLITSRDVARIAIYRAIFPRW